MDVSRPFALANEYRSTGTAFTIGAIRTLGRCSAAEGPPGMATYQFPVDREEGRACTRRQAPNPQQLPGKPPAALGAATGPVALPS